MADWGNVPEWVGAVGTVAAFAATWALLRHEISVRRQEQADRDAEQARQVTVGLTHAASGRKGHPPISSKVASRWLTEALA